MRTFGRLDILVNMASIYREKALDAITDADWAADLDVNLRSAFLCAHAAVPHLRRAGGGRIVNFADWLARSGRPRYPGFTSYYVAKAGVIALTEALALELAKRSDSGQRHRARPDRARRPIMSQAEVDDVSAGRRRSVAGAARSRSRRRW